MSIVPTNPTKIAASVNARAHKRSRDISAQRKSSESLVTMWLDETTLYVAVQKSDGQLLEIDHVAWNGVASNEASSGARQAPATTATVQPLQTASDAGRLGAALMSLARQVPMSRCRVRLCLSDRLCVTRVVTGDNANVERELDDVRSRSQLYLSLGLGEKLTGCVTEARTGQPQYALTSIANVRSLQTIHDAFRIARIKLESIEPVTLAITRGVGALGLDSDQPILLASVDRNRCDLAITRGGRLMLSYPLKGAQDTAAIASQIVSHLTRLKRFCQRYRLQDSSPLQSLLILGDSEESLRRELLRMDEPLLMPELELPGNVQFRCKSGEIPHVVKLTLWASRLWQYGDWKWLPPPDLLGQLLERQTKPFATRAWDAFWPATTAAILLLTLCGIRWADIHNLQTYSDRLTTALVTASLTEQELRQWEEKQLWVDEYQKLERELDGYDWSDFLTAIAPCIPINARLETLSQRQADTLDLRGTMIEEDRSYEMVSALRRLPMVRDVAIQSIHNSADGAIKQYQFELQLKLKAAVPKLEVLADKTRESNMVPHLSISPQNFYAVRTSIALLNGDASKEDKLP